MFSPEEENRDAKQDNNKTREGIVWLIDEQDYHYCQCGKDINCRYDRVSPGFVWPGNIGPFNPENKDRQNCN